MAARRHRAYRVSDYDRVRIRDDGNCSLGAWRWLRARRMETETWLDSKRFLRTLVIAAPLGFIAIGAGWVVTEVGGQPWIIYGVMRTAEALTPMPGLIVPFVTFTLLYIFLFVITV